MSRGSRQCLAVEHAMVIAALREDRRAWRDAASRLHRSQGDPGSLCRIAQEHRLVPALHRFAESVDWEGLSGEPARELARAYAFHQLESEHLLREIGKVARVLDESGVAFLLLKGPALAMAAYDGPACRQSVDMDLLIGEEDVDRALEALRSRGYRECQPMRPRQARVHRRHDMELTLLAPGSRIPLDIHWKLAVGHHGACIETRDAFDDAVICDLGAARVRSLSLGHMIASHCVNATRDGWNRLGQVRDLWGLVQAGERHRLEWAGFLERMTAGGMAAPVHLGLSLARLILERPLPEGLSKVEDRPAGGAGSTRDRIARRLLEGTPRPDELSPLAVGMLMVRMRESWTDKAGYVLGRLFRPTARDWEAIDLPDGLFFLFYLVRPVRLLLYPLRRALRPRRGEARPGAREAADRGLDAPEP